MNDHVRRLREMAEGLPLRGRTRIIPADWESMLAGAEALERLEAMESTSSTMSPKSASVSEAQ